MDFPQATKVARLLARLWLIPVALVLGAIGGSIAALLVRHEDSASVLATITTVSTVFLVAITGYYARQSRLTVVEMQTERTSQEHLRSLEKAQGPAGTALNVSLSRSSALRTIGVTVLRRRASSPATS
jgi:hypothetical protein